MASYHTFCFFEKNTSSYLSNTPSKLFCQDIFLYDCKLFNHKLHPYYIRYILSFFSFFKKKICIKTHVFKHNSVFLKFKRPLRYFFEVHYRKRDNIKTFWYCRARDSCQIFIKCVIEVSSHCAIVAIDIAWHQLSMLR